MDIRSANANAAGSSGDINVRSGQSVATNSGSVCLSTGASRKRSGDLSVHVGQTDGGCGGHLLLSPRHALHLDRADRRGHGCKFTVEQTDEVPVKSE